MRCIPQVFRLPRLLWRITGGVVVRRPGWRWGNRPKGLLVDLAQSIYLKRHNGRVRRPAARSNPEIVAVFPYLIDEREIWRNVSRALASIGTVGFSINLYCQGADAETAMRSWDRPDLHLLRQERNACREYNANDQEIRCINSRQTKYLIP